MSFVQGAHTVVILLIKSFTHSSVGGTTLSYDLLFEIKSKSNDSRTIFARRLVCHLLDEETVHWCVWLLQKVTNDRYRGFISSFNTGEQKM